MYFHWSQPVSTVQELINTLKRTKQAATAKESAERRLSLLYATHELFRQTSKNLDMDFDYEAWTEAVRALVPWTVRKQKSEVDKAKINKSVGVMWLSLPLSVCLLRVLPSLW